MDALPHSARFRLHTSESLRLYQFSLIVIDMILRETYLAQLRQLKDQDLIKVATGVRRCGKSTLLEQFRDELLVSGVEPACIIFLNFEKLEMEELTDYKALYAYLTKKLHPHAMNYIFLDEIQKVEEFEKVVDSLQVKKNVDLYITGSNAFMLSGDLATLLSGRYISINVQPFSFQEYVAAFADVTNEITQDRLFAQYLDSSSMPRAVTLSRQAPDMVNTYLRDVSDTVIYKDIAKRHKIRSLTNLERTIQFLLSSVGSTVSSTRIAEKLGNMSHSTVINYIEYLTKAYLFYRVQRYDIKGKRLLQTNEKYYVVDLGLRNILLSESLGADRGHKLENAVYLELLRRGGEVWVGKNKEKEVDFLVQQSSGKRAYYQVAYTVAETDTLKRELAPLQSLRDDYPKYLITTDYGTEDYQGIPHLNAVDWFLGKSG